MPGASYVWTITNGTIHSTPPYGNQVTFSSNGTSVLDVLEINGLGIPAHGTAMASSLAAPVFTLSDLYFSLPSGAQLPLNDSLTATVTNPLSFGVTYDWTLSSNGTSTPEGSTPTVSFPGPSSVGAYSLTCTVTNPSLGNSNTYTLSFTVAP